MGPTWDRQDPGGSHVGPIILAIWGTIYHDRDIIWKTTHCQHHSQSKGTIHIFRVPSSTHKLKIISMLFTQDLQTLCTALPRLLVILQLFWNISMHFLSLPLSILDNLMTYTILTQSPNKGHLAGNASRIERTVIVKHLLSYWSVQWGI